jgi:hypothetical protein
MFSIMKHALFCLQISGAFSTNGQVRSSKFYIIAKDGKIATLFYSVWGPSHNFSMTFRAGILGRVLGENGFLQISKGIESATSHKMLIFKPGIVFSSTRRALQYLLNS